MNRWGGYVIGICTMLLVQLVNETLHLGLGIWSKAAIAFLLDVIIITAAFMGRE